MKLNQWKLLVMLAAIASITFFTSCKDDDNKTKAEEKADAKTEKVTQFALDVLQDVYLWSSEIPTVDVTKIKDPISLVDSIKYSADHWTTLTDDASGLTSNFAGEGTSFGYSLGVYLFSHTSTQCYAVVQFVYPGTPAEKAGIKRGDLILQINGKEITTSNYTDLFYTSSISLGMASLNGNTISLNGTKIPLTASTMYQEPVNTYKVIDKGTHKIGYLCYTDYTLKSNQKLLDVFKSFKTAGVTDVVLDLRYNRGGYSLSAQFLSSILAPSSIVDGKNIYLQQTWNTKYNAYYKSKGVDLNEYYKTDYSYEDEDNNKIALSTKDANMNLTKLYVLVSGSTASASEATITGLSPYISVTTIGEQTSGKYCGGIVFTPSDIYDNPDKDLNNWGIYTMVYRYSDKNGNTPCMPDGFTPTYKINDDPFDGYSLGNENEPLLAKALELITGVTPTKAKTKGLMFTPKVLKNSVSRSGKLHDKLIELPGRYQFK